MTLRSLVFGRGRERERERERERWPMPESAHYLQPERESERERAREKDIECVSVFFDIGKKLRSQVKKCSKGGSLFCFENRS